MALDKVFWDLTRIRCPINESVTLKTRRSLRLIVKEAIMYKVMDQVRDTAISKYITEEECWPVRCWPARQKNIN